jgi:hypothetical protein
MSRFIRYGIRAVAVAVMMIAITTTASAQQTSTANGFTLSFNSVSYDWANQTSTWNYTLVWNKTEASKHELSHLTIGVCAGTLTSSSPSASQGPDPKSAITGVKWEGSIPDGVSTSYSFTLNGVPAVGAVPWAAKASTAINAGVILGPSCLIARPSLSTTVTNCAAAAFVGDPTSWVLSVESSGNVPLDLAVSGVTGTTSIPAGATVTFPRSAPAFATGTMTTTATATATYYGNAVASQTVSCSTEVYALQLQKSANTSFTRNYNWTLTKAVAPQHAVVGIGPGETKSVDFVVGASRVQHDGNWNVSGVIRVTNPAPIPATAHVSDDLGGQTIPVDCGSAQPVIIPAGSSIQCSYSHALPNGNSRTNLGKATLLNGTSFLTTAPVEFNAPSQVIDATLSVTDTVSCPQGFTCSMAGNSLSFSSDGQSLVSVSVTNASALCATFYTISNHVTATEQDGAVRSAAATFTDGITTARCASGCTLTIGFWKTHAGFSGRNEDVVTQYLPQHLGSTGGEMTRRINDRFEAVRALSMGYGEPSNGITKLYAQLLAAKLNVARGASVSDVAATISAADAFLATRNESHWAGLTKAQRSQVITWMSLLDGYNNGTIGPGHCN